MVHVYNPGTQEADAGCCKFRASLGYAVSSRSQGLYNETLSQNKANQESGNNKLDHRP